MYFFLAFLTGVVAGLRSLTPLAGVSWAARFGRLQLGNTWAAFMRASLTPYIFTMLALVELVTDKLPTTPSRKVPVQFGARVLTGSFSGAAVGAAVQMTFAGLVAGAVGAVAGTLAGAALRARLATAFGGSDLPAALTEDAIAIAAIAVIAWNF